MIFAVLVALAAVAFTATFFITKAYGRRQDSLARQWLQRGETALKANRPADAVVAFRTALKYSHDSTAYRLRLAQALAADNQDSQAIAYFLGLWEEQPGNGLYNLELARLYSQLGDTRRAARYYSGAIYGAWDVDPAVARRNARLEFIRFLLAHDYRTQAQAEAVILAAGVAPNDIPSRLQAAKVLFDTGELDRALAEYSSLIRYDRVPAATGAGLAAFQLGKFESAIRYLNMALSEKAENPQIIRMLQEAKSVIDADPNRRHISSWERADRVLNAYVIAGRRLESCAATKNVPLEANPPETDLQKLYSERATGPRLNKWKLASDPDMRDSVMDLVYQIEETTAQECGMPTGKDWALLMLSRYGEGVER